MDARAAAMRVLVNVCCNGRSLGTALPDHLCGVRESDRALTQELCYGVLRWQPRLQLVIERLLTKPLKQRECDIHCLLLLGLYQLIYTRIPSHAAVAETVSAVKQTGKPWMKGMVNAVLRNFLRSQDQLLPGIDVQEVARYAHPKWMIELIRDAWPEQWQDILSANNQRPPMSLRVNCSIQSRERYLEKLKLAGITGHPARHAIAGIILDRPSDIALLPGFDQGAVSIQDSAAQLAAELLDVRPRHRVLDACAAPGGKTCHVFEQEPALSELVAVEIDKDRMRKIRENIQRIGARATLMLGDASDPDAWWDGQQFDRILLDAPCSASGVIRRNPDIKFLRKHNDIDAVIRLQSILLKALWPLLKTGGMLLYATCSVLPGENVEQIKNFLLSHQDAEPLAIDAEWGCAAKVGRQILPGEDEMDGFYYARIRKN